MTGANGTAQGACPDLQADTVRNGCVNTQTHLAVPFRWLVGNSTAMAAT